MARNIHPTLAQSERLVAYDAIFKDMYITMHAEKDFNIILIQLISQYQVYGFSNSQLRKTQLYKQFRSEKFFDPFCEAFNNVFQVIRNEVFGKSPTILFEWRGPVFSLRDAKHGYKRQAERKEESRIRNLDRRTRPAHKL